MQDMWIHSDSLRLCIQASISSVVYLDENGKEYRLEIKTPTFLLAKATTNQHKLQFAFLFLHCPPPCAILTISEADEVNLADDLMTKSAQLYVQRLKEKLLFAEKSIQTAESSLQTVEQSLREKEQEVQTMKIELQNKEKDHANQIAEIKSRHNNELKELRAEGEKSWTLVNHLMRTLQKSKELMKSREELVVAQATKLKQVEKEVTECKENIVTRATNLVLGISKAANVTASLMQIEEGNWKVLGHYQEMLEQQASSIELLSTMASNGVTRNKSLRLSEDEEGHLVSATLCQCLPDLPDTPEPTEVTLTLVKDEVSWFPQWSAWQYDNCKTIALSNGTSIDCGEGGSKSQKKLQDLNMEVWEEEVEEIACQSCESYSDNWSTKWSAWEYDEWQCKTVGLSDGTSIDCGDGGTKTRKRLTDLKMEVWKEEVEEVPCQTCESFNDVCVNYKELNSPTRRSSNAAFLNRPTYCDDRNAACSIDWKGTGWYRITGEAGTKLVDSPVDHYHCGTYVTGWLSGGHPTFGQGEVERTVYFKYGNNDTFGISSGVKVVNCNTHYVYYLVDTKTFNVHSCYGYCTE